MSAEPVRRRKNRKTNTSLGIPHTFSFPLLPTHECRAVNLHMMTLKILFHMDVKWRNQRRKVVLHIDGIAVIHWATFRRDRGARQQSGDIMILSGCCEVCFGNPSYH